LSEEAPWSDIVSIADLSAAEGRRVSLTPDIKTREAVARALGIRDLRKLRLEGRLSPIGTKDWQLVAKLGATVVQDCVVTLAPVTTRIDETFTRSYLADIPELFDADEVEIPLDDTAEPLAAEIDLGAVMMEALALALPTYPHAVGVEPFDQNFAAPGIEPMSDDEAKPFSGLSAMRTKMKDSGS